MNSRLAQTRVKIPEWIGQLGPREMLSSVGLNILKSKFAASVSYQNATELMNESLYRNEEDRFKPRTMCSQVERIGMEMKAGLEMKSQEILQSYGIMDGKNEPNDEAEKREPQGEEWRYDEKEVRKIADEYNSAHDSEDEKISEAAIKSEYEKEEYATYICPDDIGVHKQKEHRKSGKQTGEKETGKKHRQYVENTVISVHTHGEDGASKTQYFAGVGMRMVFLWTLAFLLVSGKLRGKKLIFFSDGASNIRTKVKEIFGFRQYEIRLDWFHLCKKLEQLLSMGIRSTEKRNEILDKLKKILWAGNVDHALKYIANIDSKYIKSKNALDHITTYLTKHKSEIPCYAIRRHLGLRNSSQSAESANYILVANRQKTSGMSWSRSGSEALAIIQAVYENGETENWFRTRSFSMFHNTLTGKAA